MHTWSFIWLLSFTINCSVLFPKFFVIIVECILYNAWRGRVEIEILSSQSIILTLSNSLLILHKYVLSIRNPWTLNKILGLVKKIQLKIQYHLLCIWPADEKSFLSHAPFIATSVFAEGYVSIHPLSNGLYTWIIYLVWSLQILKSASLFIIVNR